jgi:uncharacterized protein YdhG (YjbR/CyaY superfamily)
MVISADDYLKALDHLFKAVLQVARETILNVDPRITEQVKWNAPSLSHNGLHGHVQPAPDRTSPPDLPQRRDPRRPRRPPT